MSGIYRVTLYRDDSVTSVVFEDVKHVFWTAGNTVLTIAQYDHPAEPLRDSLGRTTTADLVRAIGHHYINWPRERFCWYKIERA